jgi:hypothetical protein
MDSSVKGRGEEEMSMPKNHELFAFVFKSRIGRTFSTAQIERLMLAESGIQLGSVRPNDHGEGNQGDCPCVGTEKQIFERLARGVYRVRSFRM